MADEPLDYASPDTSVADATPRRGWPSRRAARLLPTVLLTGFTMLLGSVLYTALTHETNGQRWQRYTHGVCVSRLAAIGEAIDAYAGDHGGALPDSFVTLRHVSQLSPRAFNCPVGSDEPATAPATFEGSPADCGYVYCGDGVTATNLTADVVLAYDRLDNHDREGINVLFGDGSVRNVRFAPPANRPGAAALDPVWSSLEQQRVTGVRPVRATVGGGANAVR